MPDLGLLQTRYKMTMGLQPMQPDDWIEIDEDYEEEMRLRQQLVQERRDIVIASQPQVCCVSCSKCTCPAGCSPESCCWAGLRALA